MAPDDRMAGLTELVATEDVLSRKEQREAPLYAGRIKVHPIVDWDNRQVQQYLKQADLPYHPLWEQGYLSIGDWHSSRPVTAEVDE